MAKKESKTTKTKKEMEEQVNNTEAQATDNTENTDNTSEQLSNDKVIEELSLKVSEINDKYLRLTAEYDNYRKRTLKERMELMKSAGEGILKGILPVVDDFDRALAHINSASDINALSEGIALIHNKFKEFLKQNGVVEIDAIEKDFDTDLHEAITKIPAPTEQMKGKVIDCVEKGYMINDKVMRFSKVVIGE